MTYQEAIRYLNSFVNYEQKKDFPYKKSFKLERFENFLKSLGNPQAGLNCLHVAGTKGKGSVCIYLAYILREAGLRVGLYTSPHLLSVRERIRLLGYQSQYNNQPGREWEGVITRKALTDLVERLHPAIEKYNKESKYGALSFFEVYTALAFMYFREKKVDYAVLETGLGGRLDATNTAYPLVCGITPISFDHMDKLGKSLKAIAREKAGIVKRYHFGFFRCKSIRQLMVVSANQAQEARLVIRKRCKEKKAKLFEVGKDIFWRRKKQDKDYQQFDIKGINRYYRGLKIRLLGEHQLANAAQAVGMVEALGDERINFFHIKGGLGKAIWPGRLELVSRKPFFLLDGAQNAASAEAIREALRKYFRYKKLVLVLGICRDKDIKGVCDVFSDFADEIILTKAQNPRAAEPGYIRNILNRPAVVIENVRDAVSLARIIAGPRDLILITGSLFVVGEVREILIKNLAEMD